jgi:hypothetical protein
MLYYTVPGSKILSKTYYKLATIDLDLGLNLDVGVFFFFFSLYNVVGRDIDRLGIWIAKTARNTTTTTTG